MTQADAVSPVLNATASRPRIFYGWYIVLGAIVAQFVAIGMQGQVSGVFLRPMSEDLGWTRAQFTIATSLGTGVSGLIGFFVGGYVDRVGARPLMVTGVTIVGATLLATSRVQELWQFVLLRGVAFTIGFVLIGNLVVNVAVSKWFVERRGWAISMASLGVSAAGMVVPVAMVRVVDTLGWRDGWVVMGLVAWALVYPVALVMRRQPEDYGLLPDGKVEGRAEDAAAVAAIRQDFANSFTRGQAVRTLTMWLLVVGFGLAMVGLISLLFHTIPFLTDNGYSRTDAALMASSQGASALLSKFVWGWAMQRFHPRGLAALSFLMSGLAVLAMVPIAHSGSLPLMFTAFIIWGWGIGGMIPLSEFIWASFFGRRHLGAVRSAGMPVTIIFSATGPFFAGSYFDAVGSYDGALVTFASLWFVATVLILLARRPKPRPATPAAPVTGEHPAILAAVGSEAGAKTEDREPELAEPVADLAADAARPRPPPQPPPQPSPAAAPIAASVPMKTSVPMKSGEPAPDAPPPEPLEVTEMEHDGQEVVGAAAPGEGPRRASKPRPRDYMAEDGGAQPLRDYMRQQLELPRERPADAAAAAAAAEGTPEHGATHEHEHGAMPEHEHEPAPAAVASESAAFEAVEAVAEEAADDEPPMPEERVPYQPPPARRANYGPPAWASLPGAGADGGLRPPPFVNLGQATRAIQRHIPSALSYYRRDGVSTAVWAGLATSVAVTAAVWMLTRSSK